MVVVADAHRSPPQHPRAPGDGYAAAMTNFRYIASDVLTTEEALQEIAA
ncbi:hypothetical protein [Nesterenkonia sp. AN1]|nr:hypothetical protein [Nesterenkonia sp. AN1]